MNLSEYFNKGRDQEKEFARRKAARQPQRRSTKLPFYHPASLLIGAGVFYEMAYPILKVTVIPIAKGWLLILKDIWHILKSDVKIVSKKVTKKVDPDWEVYKRFDELARGKQ